MAFFTPLTSDFSYMPSSLVETSLVDDALTNWFDFDAFRDDALHADALYDIQPFSMIDESNVELFPDPSSYPIAIGFPTVTQMPQANEPHCVSPSMFLQPLDEWFASQIDVHSAMDSGSDSLPSISTPSHTDDSSSCDEHHKPSHVVSHVGAATSSTSHSLKRRADDSDYEDSASSSCSEYTPRRPAKRLSPSSRKTIKAPLPANLQPIKVQSTTLPRCPMPGCDVLLEDKDSAWRGHFKKIHHDELCLTAGCRGQSGACKARCPFPIPGCKSCASGPHEHEHEHGKKAGGAMTIESVGRHLLNIHIKVAFRCPLCGLENQWRESACVRHIRRCAEKRAKEGKKRAAL
ncbi:hypothetical protein C8Q80DRAFT_1267166 [Daedaleopsis nitida]|nr:hypothetical protein C8Q80DRAFT_1267166 [Daedaleopsis nitida]